MATRQKVTFKKNKSEDDGSKWERMETENEGDTGDRHRTEAASVEEIKDTERDSKQYFD